MDPATGDRKQKTKGGFKTKKEAQTACATLALELDQGTYVKEVGKTFKDFAEEWLVIYSNTGRVKVSSISLREYQSSKLMTYFRFEKIKDITRKKYQDALFKLKESGLHGSTLNGINTTGRMIFKKAVEMGYIKNDPTQYAVVPRSQQTVEEVEGEVEIPKYLEKSELSTLLETARLKGLHSDYVVFKLLAYSGMRLGELCALKWSDIDFGNHAISITKTYYNKNSNAINYILQTPKTKTSKRVISIDETVLESLEQHKSIQNIYKMEHRDNYHDENFVFINSRRYPGYPRPLNLFEDRMKRLLKLANLNQILTPHSLRHTHTSLLAEAGVGLAEIMDRLGHKDDATTKAVYLHVTKTMKKEASDKFSELMKSL